MLLLTDRIVSDSSRIGHFAVGITVTLCHALVNIILCSHTLVLKSNETSMQTARTAINKKKPTILRNTHVHKAWCYTHQTVQCLPSACNSAHHTQAQDWYKHVTVVDDHHRMLRHTQSIYPSLCSRHLLKN